VKADHLKTTKGLGDYLRAFASEKSLGKDGYLTERGLIPLADDLRRAEAAKVAQLLRTVP
jgi:phosphate transport system substrate-binding protein